MGRFTFRASGLAGLFVLTAGASALAAEVKAFDEKGVIVDIYQFFSAARQSAEPGFQPEEAGLAGRALVTAGGVYSFLENPENARWLKDVKPGSPVRVTGSLLAEGALLQIDQLKTIKRDPGIDLEQFGSAEGREVTLAGKNKCQCGLKVGTLPVSCELGHLHHLETEDGKIYHYLQFGQARDVYLGKGFHFKDVRVQGRELPGQFLLVESVEIVN
ncbi:MAG TPA: hypothetical protein VJ417_04135 [Candidatus Glassbacteria bacterium]|nr:hypothetical protein [Candidatus Glassbacteria bacterium]